MVGSWFRMFKGDRIRIKETLLGELVQQEMGEHRIELGMPMQDKMLLMQAQENGVVLDEEELLFLAGEQTNTFDADVDDQPVRDLAQNDDNIFQADECDAFDSDVDDKPTAQSIFMANLSSIGPANLQVGPSNASILSEVHDSADMGNSNIIPYKQYVKHYEGLVIPSGESSIPNDAYVMHENSAYVPGDSLVTELSIYKQQVAMYEQRAKFDLTLSEQKMDEQMRMLIQDRNKKEENLKNELHSVKLQLNSTIKSNTIIEETVTALKHEFKQKETKFLTDFSNLKTLNDKLENKLYAQDQSIQTVHMMLKPKKLHDHDDVTVVGAQNPFYLRKAKVAQPALYDGDEILKTHHVPVSVTSSEEDLEIAEITRQKMNEKMNDPDVLYIVTDSPLSASRFHDLSTDYNVAMTRIVELESENSKLLDKIQHDSHDTMVKDFSKLEVAHLNLQLKYQHLKENIENFKSKSSKDVPEFDTFFELGIRDDQIQGHRNTIRKLKAQISQLKANKSDELRTLDYKSLDS
ncbi:hypothetical protein Tco_0088957 [Tanacetum coccineum]